jgi:two-component system OmpR family sensor kinase
VAATVLSGERAAAQVLDARRRVLLVYGDAVAQTPLLSAREVAAVKRGERVDRTARRDAGSGGFRVVAQPVTHRGRRQVVAAAESMAPVQSSIDRVVILLLLACPVALVLTVVGGWWLARRALRPVDRMTATAERIEVERLDQRLEEPRTDDEIARLARTLNAMLERIRVSVQQQRRLVEDASHELRSPLAAMRSEIDVSLRADELPEEARAVLESVREEVDRLSRTVDDLLTLASIDEGGLTLAREAVDLSDLARATGAALAPLAERSGVTVHADGEPAVVVADPERVRQALGNLIDNAIKFSPPGGVVDVTTSIVGGAARVAVTDEGPGIRAEDRERIFERFVRADAARSRSAGGSGLGLAIARDIVTAHGGGLTVEGRSPRGSAFAIELPIADAGHAAAGDRRPAPAEHPPAVAHKT